MKKINLSLNSVLLFIVALTSIASLGCGGSSSTRGPAVSVDFPADGSTFVAGDTINLRLSMDGFTLGAPVDVSAGDPTVMRGELRSLALRDHPADDASDHGADDHHDSGDTDSGHHDDSGKTNPSAKQGHIHIYLNEAAGSDPHITAWSAEVPVKLPDDLAAGSHSLRIELRDDHHTLVGNEFDSFFFFEVR